MNNWINSFFEANLALLVFYIFYFIWIKRDGNIRYQRFFLLFSIIASIVLSVFNFNYSATVNDSPAIVMLDTITVNVQDAKQNLLGFDFSNALLIGYLSICILLIVNFLVKLFVVILAIQKIKSRIAINNGVYYYNGKMAFSFFKFIALPQQLSHSADAEAIVIHEKTHSRQWHTLDIILADILCAVFWINPFAWLYRKSLKETHEYLADAAVKEHYCDLDRYQMLLFNNAVGTQMGLANCFNHSLTLKRLIMLTQKSTSKLIGLKTLILLSVSAFLLVVLACNKQPDSKTDYQNQAMQVVAENNIGQTKIDADEQKEIAQQQAILAEQEKAKAMLARTEAENQKALAEQQKQLAILEKNKAEQELFKQIDKMPSFPGGQSAMTNFLLKNIKYPAEAKEKGIQGKVFVQFVVLETGKIENVKVAQPVNELLDAEAIRVVKTMPDWIPGKSKGKAVKVNYSLPIIFALGDKK